MPKPKSSFIVRSPNVLNAALPAIVSLAATVVLVAVALFSFNGNWGSLLLTCLPALITLGLSLFFAYRVFHYHLHKLTLNSREIALHSLFGCVKRVSWTMVESVHVCEFGRLDTVRRGAVQFGGVDIHVPKEIPPKWIMIADVKEDFCESIYEFMIPNGDLRAIKVVFDPRIITAIQYYTEKQIIYKKIG